MIETDTPHGKVTVMMIEEFEELKEKTEQFKKEEKVPGYGLVVSDICILHNCDLMVAKIKYPLWDSPFPQGGSGKVLIIEAPYCPQCTREEDLKGYPIADVGSYHYVTPEPAVA